MRESDRVLAADLRDAGLEDLAVRAETGEWNDYFGQYTFPQICLVGVLREQVKLANVVRQRLISNVMAGKYDGTRAESAEWAASPEGADVFTELLRGGHERT